MSFKFHTFDELFKLGVQDGSDCLIEYQNKDYFNGEETIEKATAKAILQDNKFVFLVPDPYGMDRFIEKVKILKIG
jgi:hypothetical protein